MGVAMDNGIKHWTAKRKTALVIDRVVQQPLGEIHEFDKFIGR